MMATFKNVLTLLFIIIGVHIMAIVRSWYWSIAWIDIPMHFFGGFWVALLALFILKTAPGLFGRPSFLSNFLLIIGFVALMGIFWEFFEFTFDQISNLNNFNLLRSQVSLQDTMGDLFFDLLGGLIGFFCEFLIVRKN